MRCRILEKIRCARSNSSLMRLRNPSLKAALSNNLAPTPLSMTPSTSTRLTKNSWNWWLRCAIDRSHGRSRFGLHTARSSEAPWIIAPLCAHWKAEIASILLKRFNITSLFLNRTMRTTPTTRQRRRMMMTAKHRLRFGLAVDHVEADKALKEHFGYETRVSLKTFAAGLATPPQYFPDDQDW